MTASAAPAQAEAARRREAIRVLTLGWHTVGAGARCPLCRGPVVVGATVRIAHARACPRARHGLHLAAVPRPAPVPQPEPRKSCRPAAAAACAPASPARRRHRCRSSRGRRRQARPAQRACYYERFGRHEQIRPGRWFISGARVKACGQTGTARRLTGSAGNLQVAVVLDGEQAARLFAVADLARAGGAR